MQLHNSKNLATYLDVTERRVRQLRDEGVLVEVRTGLYDLKASTVKYIQSLKGWDTANLNYNEEKAKLTKAKREREELELREREKNLHESQEVAQIISRMLTNFKSRLMSIPSKMSPKLAKKTDQTEIYSLLKEAIYEALEELSDYNTLFKEGEQDE